MIQFIATVVCGAIILGIVLKCILHIVDLFND